MANKTEQIDKKDLRIVLGKHSVSYAESMSAPYETTYIYCADIFGQRYTIKCNTIEISRYGDKIKSNAAFVERGDTIVVHDGELIRNLTADKLAEKFLAKHIQFVR